MEKIHPQAAEFTRQGAEGAMMSAAKTWEIAYL
jgi:hypothetical protein